MVFIFICRTRPIRWSRIFHKTILPSYNKRRLSWRDTIWTRSLKAVYLRAETINLKAYFETYKKISKKRMQPSWPKRVHCVLLNNKSTTKTIQMFQLTFKSFILTFRQIIKLSIADHFIIKKNRKSSKDFQWFFYKSIKSITTRFKKRS